MVVLYSVSFSAFNVLELRADLFSSVRLDVFTVFFRRNDPAFTKPHNVLIGQKEHKAMMFPWNLFVIDLVSQVHMLLLWLEKQQGEQTHTTNKYLNEARNWMNVSPSGTFPQPFQVSGEMLRNGKGNHLQKFHFSFIRLCYCAMEFSPF